MTKQNSQDETVMLLIDKVKEKREQIETAQNPQWKTNCGIKIDGVNINLRTVQSESELMSIASTIMVHQLGYEAAVEELQYSCDGDYKFCGYSVDQWMDDIRTRLNKINIDKEKRNLAKLEDRLDKIISPELRAKMELEAIEKELE